VVALICLVVVTAAKTAAGPEAIDKAIRTIRIVLRSSPGRPLGFKSSLIPSVIKLPTDSTLGALHPDAPTCKA
jgi:hypothetical protein